MSTENGQPDSPFLAHIRMSARKETVERMLRDTARRLDMPFRELAGWTAEALTAKSIGATDGR